MTNTTNNRGQKKPQLRLPFTNKKDDMGQWVFKHRMGLCVTLIAYLVLSIAFVSAKIFVGGKPHTQGFYVELEDIAALEEMRDKLEAETEQAQDDFDWSSVKNQTSNSTSLDERVVDDRGTDAAELNREAQKMQEEIQANRQAYEQALDDIATSREEASKGDQDEESKGEHRDVRVKGNVTVSYSFTAPTRHAQHLVVPAYQCQGGGEVIVEVEVNRLGRVTKAKVAKGGDKCMEETAIKAAKSTTFNKSESAPESHAGTISYIFIPQ